MAEVLSDESQSYIIETEIFLQDTNTWQFHRGKLTRSDIYNNQLCCSHI
jgi:hypothetical protein